MIFVFTDNIAVHNPTGSSHTDDAVAGPSHTDDAVAVASKWITAGRN